MLSKSVDRSFNAITVDSDTSTSDTLMIFATGRRARGAPRIEDAADPRAAAFRRALDKSAQSRATGGARRRRGAQIHHRQCRGRGEPQGGQARCVLDRQFAAGQDRVRRRGCELGAGCDGGRQGGRKSRARHARDPLRARFASPTAASRSMRAAASAYGKRDAFEITVDLISARGAPRVDLRPDEGIRRDQRRLSLVKVLLVVAAALDRRGRTGTAGATAEALEGLAGSFRAARWASPFA